MFGIGKGAVGRLKWLRLKRRLAFATKTLSVIAFLALVLLLVIAFIVPRFQEKSEESISEQKPFNVQDQLGEKIQESIDVGEYEKADKLLKDALNAQPDHPELKTWWRRLNQELLVDFRFHYLPGRHKQITTRSFANDVTLTDKDPYYLTVYLSDKCYLYIFQLDDSGKFFQLFPNSQYVPTPNPVPPGPLRIPDGPEWFYLDNVPGTEYIYLVASRWRHRPLERMAASIQAQNSTKIRLEYIDKLLSRLRLEDEATDDVPGLIFAKYEFRHVKSTQ